MDYLILLVITYMVLMLASSQIPPGSPVIDGPQVIVLNSQITLTCTSPRGDPPPSVKWFFDDSEITTGISTTTAGTAVTTSLTFTATKNYHLEFLECQAENGVLQNPLSNTKYIEVHFSPVSATLTGPSTLTPGQQGIWTCISANGYPAGVMTMKNQNNNTQFTTEFTSSSVLDQKSFDVTGTLTWSPVIVNNGDTICCDVTHTTTLGSTPQTVCRQITVSYAPSVSLIHNAMNVDFGNNVTIGCVISANPSHTSVYWKKIYGVQAITIDMTNINKYGGGTLASPSLYIISADTSDAADYICFATNSFGTGQSSQGTLTVQGNAPSVSLILNAMNVDFGNNVTILCVISANPSHTSVYWKKISGVQAITIDMTNINKYGGGTLASPSLYIISADTSDAADYICFATNSFGTGQSSQGTLTVQGNAPSVSLILNAMNVDFGNNVTIGCVISANPSHTSVYWKKISGVQAITIDMTNINKYGGGTVASPSLYIISADTSDAADYICFATNSFGTGQSSQGTLTVQDAPSVSLIHNAMNVDFGNNVTIGCVISANPSHTSVYWKKISGVQAITIDMTNINKYGGGTVASPSLYIISADTSDAADYICFATNSFGTGQSSQGTLTVQGNAPSVSLIHNAMNVDFGNNVTIGCVISANPSHTSVYWKKISGVQAITIDMTNINKYGGGTVASPSLYIISADTSDAADYICFATNSFGTGQSSQGTLTVQGNAPSVSLIHSAMNVDFGNNVTIGCVISANPSHTSVYWKKISGVQAITIDMTNINKYGGGTVASPSLYIISADTSDAADYICFATNSFGTGQSSQGTLTVQGNAPSVSLIHNALNVDFGNNVSIGCVISANPSHTSVYWKKISGVQAITIDMTNTNKYGGGTVASPSLYIISADTSDAADYICFATNSFGTGQSSQGTLTVQGIIPIVTVTTSAYMVNVDSSITLECQVTADPTHNSVYWQKVIGNNTETLTINGGKYNGSSVSNPNLTISNTQFSDAGSYYCYARNMLGVGSSTQIILAVTGTWNAPSVSLIHNAMNVDFGNNVTIGCVISANPSHTSVYWKKISGVQAITIDMTNTNKYGGGTLASPSLYIISADTSDAADYICFATNSFGTGQSSQGTLTVQGIIPVVTVTTSAYMVNVDSSITLECQVTADPTHSSVYWQKVIGNNTETLTINGGKYNGSSVSNPNLTISNTQFSDAGSYYCYARNMLGVGSSTQIILAVTGTWMNYADTAITETSVNNAVPDTTMTATTVRNAFQDTTMKECSGNQVIVPAVLGTIIGLMMVTFTAQLVRDKYKRYSRSIDKVSRRSSVVHPTLKESNVTQMNNLPVEQDTIEEGYAFPRELESGETKQFQLLPPIDNRQFTTDTYLLGRPKLLPIGKVSDLNV
ncbi:hemicentin-1-like isoform X2 [Mytilus trossulus]|uniref:hemicentin-1-like isoform X2 n=1 Tax=Mytilus trossulus TaxID=6551 RepID=UPI0030077EBA